MIPGRQEFVCKTGAPFMGNHAGASSKRKETTMKSNEKLNGNFLRLISNKKLLLIPAIIATVIAAVLLAMVVLSPEKDPILARDAGDGTIILANHADAFNETKESIMGELVKCKEYLSQLEAAVTDNWGILTQVNSGNNNDETGMFSQFEELGHRITELNNEINNFSVKSETAGSELKNLLSMLAGTLDDVRENLRKSYEDYRQKLDKLGEDSDSNGTAIKNMVASLQMSLKADIENINLDLSKSLVNIQSFLATMDAGNRELICVLYRDHWHSNLHNLILYHDLPQQFHSFYTEIQDRRCLLV
jgi:hypothetical protein